MFRLRKFKVFLTLILSCIIFVSCEDISTKLTTATIPTIPWLKQFGLVTGPPGDTTNDEVCRSTTVDAAGNVYCAGYTLGGLGEPNGGNQDAMIMKFNSSGSLVWLKQLGATTSVPGNTAGFDECYSVAVDAAGNVYCAGYTSGNLGEVNGGGGSDVMVLKLNSSGDLVWLKQLGSVTSVPGWSTAGVDICNGVTVDTTGNVYCAGYTTGALGEANGGGGNQDAFVLKLDSNGNIVWLKQLGAVTAVPGGSSAGVNMCYGIAIDITGNLYCAGYTGGAFGEASGGGGDAFIAKFEPDGDLAWLRQLGAVTAVPGGSTAGADVCYGVAVDLVGNSYCAGATTGALGEANGGNDDLFVMKLAANGTLTWLTQFGTVTGADTTAADFGFSVTADATGNVFASGATRGGLGEAYGGGFMDAFVTKLASNGSLEWLTHFGAVTAVPGGSTAGFDTCNGVAVDIVGNVYCAGASDGAIGEANGGQLDVMVLKLNSSGSL